MRDRTDRLRRHLAGQLLPGEQVLAAVGLSLHGSAAASMSAAATASDGMPGFVDGGPLPAAKDAADEAGIGRWPHWFLVLTSQRLLLVRRSSFDRPKQVRLSVPLSAVETLTFSTRGAGVGVALADGRRLRLETPKAPRFLPPVYAQLPALFEQAKAPR